MKRIWLFPTVWAVALACMPNGASAGVVIPSNVTISASGTQDVPLTISGLHPPALAGFDFNVHFDPVMVSYTGVSFGDPVYGDQLNLDGFGSISFAGIVSPGNLNLYEISTDSITSLNNLQRSSFTLAVITFSGQVGATSPLSLTVNQLADPQGNPLPGPVPEPSTVVLGGLGLAALVFWRRR